jgi:hypothetical protein
MEETGDCHNMSIVDNCKMITKRQIIPTIIYILTLMPL